MRSHHPRPVRTVTAALALVLAGAGLTVAAPVGATPEVHAMGAVHSPGATDAPTLGMRALSVVAATAAPVPVSVDLSRFDPKVGYQGRVNSCVAWAIGYGMLGWFANSQGHGGAPFAPMYAYSQVNSNDQGSMPSDVLSVLSNQGIDTSAKYAPGHGGAFWSLFDWSRKPSPAERAAAAPNKITGWVTLYNTNSAPGAAAVVGLKQALAGGRPVAVMIAVFDRFERPGANAVISSAGNVGQLLGYHEVLAVGYDSRGVRIMNSWGTGWGSGGYAILDWNYIAKYSYEAETVGGFALTTGASRPTLSAVTPASGPVRGGQTVTITGTNLAHALVTVGGQSVVASTVGSDRKHLTFRVPGAISGLAGPAALSVSTPAGVTLPSALSVYTYVK